MGTIRLPLREHTKLSGSRRGKKCIPSPLLIEGGGGRRMSTRPLALIDHYSSKWWRKSQRFSWHWTAAKLYGLGPLLQDERSWPSFSLSVRRRRRRRRKNSLLLPPWVMTDCQIPFGPSFSSFPLLAFGNFNTFTFRFHHSALQSLGARIM